jgi:putative oxidoreductase
MNADRIDRRLPLVLLLLRLSVFLVMAVWTADKFFKPAHAAKVFETFYKIGGLGNTIIYGIGVIQLLIIIGFVVGFKKPLTYGAVLLMHAVSTLSSLPRYFQPFDNLLFFAAWPMLAACFTLFYLRDADRLWTIGKSLTPQIEE